jgi:polar amino acid transport system permease protein
VTAGARTDGPRPQVTPELWQPSERQQARLAYRRRRTRRSLLVSLLSSAVVAAVVILVVGSSSGWPATRSSFFALSAGWDGLPALLRALWVNVQIMLISEVLILVFAALIAFVRTLQGPVFFPLRFLATAYTDVFRGLPLILVIFLVGYGIPSLRLAGAPSSPFVLCIIALVLTYTAYVAEVFRAGIQSVHPSQRASARALGLTYTQSMRHVVFPQAVRRVLPALLNDFVSLQKDTALVASAGVFDAVFQARDYSSYNFNYTSFVVVAAFFVVMTVPLARWCDWLQRRWLERERAGAL